MIERVEGLQPELAGEALAEFHILEERKIRAPETRPANRARTLGRFRRLRSRGRGERRRVEPTAEGVRSVGIGIANLVWAATQRRSARQASGTRGIHAGGPRCAKTLSVAEHRCQRQTGLEGLDAGNLPPAKQVPDDPPLASHPGKVPNKIGRKVVAAVGDGGSVVAPQISGYLRQGGAAGASVGGIGGQAMRPRVGDVDHRISREALLKLRLQRVVVRGEEIREEQPRPIPRIGTQNVELVRVRRSVNGSGDDYMVRRARSGTRRARRRGGAIQVGIDGCLIEILEAGQVNAIASVIADINQPSAAELTLHIQAPLLGVGRLVVDGHARLNGERRRCRHRRGSPCRV